MASQPHQAAPSDDAAPASLASLPDALLEHILGLLDQSDRHHAALVSRRWHAAAHAPNALRSIDCYRVSQAQLQSLAAWLLRHGPHVRSLLLFCSIDTETGAGELATCLHALAIAASLQQLELQAQSASPYTALCVTSWCAALQQLKELSLDAYHSKLHISTSLAGLAAVTRLAFNGTRVIVDASAQLPPNVERLWLQDDSSPELPRQLSGLTRLSTLKLNTPCQPEGYAVLTCLGRLACLSLGPTEHLPACLPQLTGLHELALERGGIHMGDDAFQMAVDAALQQLTGLTSLYMFNPPERCQPPAALTALSSLQRCCLEYFKLRYSDHEPVPPTPLPPGPWAASLCSLGASLDVLECSTGALSAATQLTRLALVQTSMESDGQEAFWEWAASHPPLRRLQIEVEEEADLSEATLEAIGSLATQRPELDVTTVLTEAWDLFSKGVPFHWEFKVEI